MLDYGVNLYGIGFKSLFTICPNDVIQGRTSLLVIFVILLGYVLS